MNNATIVGRLTKDPALRTLDIGGVRTPVLNFTVAVDDGSKKDANGNKIGTEFFRVTSWRGGAEAIAKYMAKGRMIAIAGAVHLGKYADQVNGGLHYNLTIPHPTAFEFLGSSGDVEKKVVQDEAPEGLDEAIEADLPDVW